MSCDNCYSCRNSYTKSQQSQNSPQTQYDSSQNPKNSYLTEEEQRGYH